MARRFLGIDLGTGAVKALVVDEDGRIHGTGSAEIPTFHPHPGHAEQDPETWWDATVHATRQAIAQAGAARLTGIGLSGQMHGTVLLDEGDQPLHPAVIWADTRSARQVERVTEEIGKHRLIEIAGSPLAVGFQAATVRWFVEERPDLWQRVRRVTLPKDYLGWRLTGTWISEPSDAASTLLLDVRQRDWSEILLQAVGLRREMVPPVRSSVSVRGEVLPEAAEALGVPAGTPVVAGGGDAPLAALAAGVTDPSTMLLTISTGSQALVPAMTVRPDLAGRIHTWCSCLEPETGAAGWYHMGATMVSGLALRWLRDRVFALPREGGYERLTDWAARVPPGAGGLIFLPYLAGERTPHMDPRARGMFLGLTTEHGREHLTRAVMEGAILALFDAYSVLAELGAQPQRAVLAGGGARSLLWRQIVADVFGLPVFPLGDVEGSALGAALLARVGLTGADPVAMAAAWARYEPAVTPDSAAHATYAALLPIFRDAYRKHREDFPRLAELRG
jgi:xylulokinase